MTDATITIDSSGPTWGAVEKVLRSLTACNHVFENLFCRSTGISNATSDNSSIPREVIQRMASLTLTKDGNQPTNEAGAAKESKMINIMDPGCGTGGILAKASSYL